MGRRGKGKNVQLNKVNEKPQWRYCNTLSLIILIAKPQHGIGLKCRHEGQHNRTEDSEINACSNTRLNFERGAKDILEEKISSLANGARKTGDPHAQDVNLPSTPLFDFNQARFYGRCLESQHLVSGVRRLRSLVHLGPPGELENNLHNETFSQEK